MLNVDVIRLLKGQGLGTLMVQQLQAVTAASCKPLQAKQK